MVTNGVLALSKKKRYKLGDSSLPEQDFVSTSKRSACVGHHHAVVQDLRVSHLRLVEVRAMALSLTATSHPSAMQENKHWLGKHHSWMLNLISKA